MSEHWSGSETGSVPKEGVIDPSRPISAGDGAYELDAQCRLRAVDDELVELTGYERGTLLGEHVSLLVADDTVDGVEALVRTLLSGGAETAAASSGAGSGTIPPAKTTVTLELPLSSAADEVVSSTHRLRRLEHTEEVTRIAGIVRTNGSPSAAATPSRPAAGDRPPTDDADSTRRGERPTDRLPPLRELFAHETGGFYVLDSDLRYRFVNERAAELLAADSDDPRVGSSRRDESDTESEAVTAIAPSASPFDAAHDRALALQRPITVEEYHDPTSSWLEARIHPTERWIAVRVHEITGRKAYERELEAGDRRLRAIFEDAHDAVLLGDDERIAAANSAAGELLGLDRSALYGRSLKEFIHDDHDVRSAWEEFIENGRLRGSFSLVRPDETERVVEYNSVADVLPGTHLSILRDVTERHRRERQLERQRERLAALEGINDVVHEITAAVVEGATRRELERTTCESLADFPAYEFAFVAEVDAKTGEIRNRVEAGVDGYVDAIPLSTDPDDPAGRGPLGRAIRTQSMRYSTDVFADPDFEPWRDDAREQGYESAAAVPITHEGTLYGVLGVTSASSTAFEADRREILGQLGEILGHAIAAHDRKRALVSDDLIELEYEIRDVFALFDAPATDEPVRFERVVRIAEDHFLEYGETTLATFSTFERLVERVPHWEEVTVLDETDDTVTFELRIESPPMFSIVAAHGGYVERAVLEDGDYTMTVHLPKRTDVRAVTAAIQEVYPVAENVARRQVTPVTESLDRIQDDISRVLTDRQRTALETAYYAGFFEWPRTSTGEEIAERLRISPATFHEHFRAAQRKLVAAVIDRPRSILQDAPDE